MEPAGLELFMLQQRELIRKRQSNAIHKIKERAHKGAKKRGRVVPQQVGGGMHASNPPKTGAHADQIIDLLHLPDESDDSTELTDVFVSTSAPAPAPQVAANANQPQQPTPPRVHSNFRNLQQPPRGHPLNPVVPATIRALWQEVEDLYDRRQVNPPLCPSTECPYCTGPLMDQRLDLMQRLVMIEKLVWLGDRRKKR